MLITLKHCGGADLLYSLTKVFEISPQSLLEQKLQPKKERENNYSGLMSETNFFFPQLQLVLGTVEL